MVDLARRGGSIRLLSVGWSEDCLAGASVALGDFEDVAEARAFHEAARCRGVPCNVIDKPEFCDFQFGSIVNRSPVVVGISTSGAAPVLGQAVRRRIETLLPPSLAEWGRLASRLRAQVAERLPVPAIRRRFWEALASRAFGPAPASKDIASFIAAAPRPAVHASA